MSPLDNSDYYIIAFCTVYSDNTRKDLVIALKYTILPMF